MKIHRLLLLVSLAITGVMAAVVLGVISINPLLVESHVITTGKFGNFTIGENAPQTVYSILRTDPAATIRPTPSETLVVSRDNLSDISHLKMLEGVRIFDYRTGPSTDIYFSDGRIYKITRGHGDKFPQFLVGDTISSATNKFIDALKSNGDVLMIPIVDYDGAPSFDAMSASKDANSKLFKYSTWEFDVPSVLPDGAYYTLHFSNQRLYKIEYRRHRIHGL